MYYVLCQEWTNERERIAFSPHAGDRRRATVTVVSPLPPSFSLCSYDTHQCPVRKLPSFLLLAATSTTRVVTQKNKRPKSERASELSWRRRRRRRLSSPFLALSFRSRRHRSRNSAAATARFAVRRCWSWSRTSSRPRLENVFRESPLLRFVASRFLCRCTVCAICAICNVTRRRYTRRYTVGLRSSSIYIRFASDFTLVRRGAIQFPRERSHYFSF